MSPQIAKDSRRPRRRHHQRGVGLIEVLIAVLILSIGLLGIAAMQTRSLSANNSSMARSMAVLATYSILDAMRADRANAVANAYTGTVTASSCPSLSGTPSLAQRQLASWCSELGNTLGAASTTTGAIACATGDCTITITFDDSRIGSGGTSTQSVVTRGAL